MATTNNLDDIIFNVLETVDNAKASIKIFEDNHKDIFDEYNKLQEELKNAELAKDNIKNLLIANSDTDIHTYSVNNTEYKVSLSKTVKLVVDDIDKVPDNLKSMQVVADTKKAQSLVKVLGEIPTGFIDKSFYSLRIKEETKEN